MEDNIFDIITNYSVNEGINKILLGDEEYIKIQKEIDEQIKQYKQLGLTKEQYLAVDRLVSAHTASGACYGIKSIRETDFTRFHAPVWVRRVFCFYCLLEKRGYWQFLRNRYLF